MTSFYAALAGILFAAAGGQGFGASWSAIGSGLPTTPFGVTSLSVDPAQSSTLYAVTGRRTLFKSTDGGGSWRRSDGMVGISFLAIDPKNSSTVYVATSHGVYKSQDGAASWTSANSGLQDGYTFSLAISPVDSSVLYAVTNSGLFTSGNAGASWNAIGSGTGPTTPILTSLLIDPKTPSTIYASYSSRGMVKSTDGGETWTAIAPTLDLGNPLTPSANYSVTSVAIDPVNSSTIYAGFLPQVFIPQGGSPTGGVLKSMDGGKSWIAYSDGMPAGFFPVDLAIDPANPSNIYAAVNSNMGGGMVKSTDGGKSWSAIQDGLPADSTGAVTIDPSTPSTIYSYSGIYNGGAGSVFKSTQAGGSWKRADTGLDGVLALALAIDPVSRATIYAGVGDGVFKTIDGGAGWSKLVSFELHNSFSFSPGGPPLFPGPASAYPVSLAIDAVNPSVVYAWTSRRNGCIVFDNLLFKSVDGGASWSDSVSPPKNPCVVNGFLVMDPTDSNTLYVVESDDFDSAYWVRKSVDGGAGWSDIWNSEEFGLNALLIDRANPSTLFAGTGGGVFRSFDGGGSWNNIGLKGSNVTALAADPDDSSILYAATAGVYPQPQSFRNLMKSSDGGASWAAAGDGLASVGDVGAVITSLIATANKTLYAGTSGDGVYKSADGGASWRKLNDGLLNLDVRVLMAAPGVPNSFYAATGGGIFTMVDESQ